MSFPGATDWHIRGALTGCLYGFPDSKPEIIDFFLLPIDVAAIGLTDFGFLVGDSLPGLRYVLHNLCGYYVGFRKYDEVIKNVFQHFNFYTKYKVAFKIIHLNAFQFFFTFWLISKLFWNLIFVGLLLMETNDVL